MVYLHGCPETDARGTDAVYALRSVHLSDAGMSPADKVVHLATYIQIGVGLTIRRTSQQESGVELNNQMIQESEMIICGKTIAEDIEYEEISVNATAAK